MKKSEEIKIAIKAVEDKYDALSKSEVYQNPTRTAENHDELWSKFYRTYGQELSGRKRELEDELHRALNQEVEVGDGVTLHLWSDAHACTVIARTEKTLTIRQDKAIRDPNFKPEWVPGGFSAICTNDHEQSWSYEPDPKGEITKCRWSEKFGRWQAGLDGSIHITRGRHEHYDYNF